MNKPNNNLLEVRNLTVRYGGVIAVDNINFTVGQGEVVTIIGANGAGKSSTLMALCGLAVASGEILFENEHIERLTPVERVKLGIIQVPEGRHIFPRLSVRENLLMGAYSRTNKDEIEEELNRVMEIFPILRERQNQTGGTLSGGEQQMLAIARGLMAKPRLLLLDEPSLGLSPIFTARIFKIIDQLSQEGRSILLVEQNARAALKVANRGYCLETGRIILEGTSSFLSQNTQIKAVYLGG